ncbi:MAG: YciI family protein [Pseudomonadota bacterium]
MPVWDDYKATAKSRGALAMELYVLQSTPIDPLRIPDLLPDHLAYQKVLEDKGVLVMAGPLSDESGTLMEGAGHIVYRAESLDAAKAIAEADPMHKEGVRSFTIRKWLVNEGSLSFTLSLSSQSVSVG